MGPTAEDLRCPQCRAAVREGAPWCTQCYASLLPVDVATDVRVDAVGEHPVGVAPASVPAPPRVAVQLLPEELRGAAEPDAAWPCTTCGASNALDDATCASCGSPFLSAVREAEPPLLALPGVGDVVALSRAQRLGLGAAVVLAVLVLVLLLGLLTG